MRSYGNFLQMTSLFYVTSFGMHVLYVFSKVIICLESQALHMTRELEIKLATHENMLFFKIFFVL
jgi:hypothetical protein